MSDLSTGLTRTAPVYSGKRELHFVTFKIGEWEFGVDVAMVKGIYHGLPMIPTPDAPDSIAGDIQISGERIPTLYVARLLGLNHSLKNGNWWMVVLQLPGGPLALIADEMKEVVRLDAKALGEFNDDQHPVKDYVTTVARYQQRTIYLLNYRALAQELRK